jgi:hypothetical protein
MTDIQATVQTNALTVTETSRRKQKLHLKSTNLIFRNYRDCDTREVGQVYMATSDKTSPDGTLLDSGGTSHMFRQHHLFTNYRPSTEDETISVGSNFPLRVARRGSVKIKSQLANGIRTVILHDVLNVPHLATNIVSLGTLQREGAAYHSSRDGLVVIL